MNDVYIDQDDLEDYEKGNYYVLSSEYNSQGNISIVLDKKAFPFIPVVIGVVAFIAITVTVLLILKKRKKNTIAQTEVL